MTTTRKPYSPQFKARVALEAIRGEKTLSQLGSQFKVHPMQIAKWRKSAIDQLPDLFVDGRTRKAAGAEADSRPEPFPGYGFPRNVGLSCPSPPCRVSQVPRLICPCALSPIAPGGPAGACSLLPRRLQASSTPADWPPSMA
jgi:transposase